MTRFPFYRVGGSIYTAASRRRRIWTTVVRSSPSNLKRQGSSVLGSLAIDIPKERATLYGEFQTVRTDSDLGWKEFLKAINARLKELYDRLQKLEGTVDKEHV